MFLKTLFLEGKRRREEIYNIMPPRYVFQFSERIVCAPNGEFDKLTKNSAVSYAWFVWEKGWKEDTIIRWI